MENSNRFDFSLQPGESESKATDGFTPRRLASRPVAGDPFRSDMPVSPLTDADILAISRSIEESSSNRKLPGSNVLAETTGKSNRFQRAKDRIMDRGRILADATVAKRDNAFARVGSAVDTSKRMVLQAAERSRIQLSSAKQDVVNGAQTAKQKVLTTAAALQGGIQAKADELANDVRTNPIKWAGISAGAGAALGLFGRYLHWRAHGRPQVVVVRSC